MTDNEIKKTEDTEVIKIKAIYPHIVVGGTVDKPCYSIDWYDIEAQTMHTGYSSYNLKNVQEWLKEHFEVVEYDIENLINRLQAENEKNENIIRLADKTIETANAEIEKLRNHIQEGIDLAKQIPETIAIIKDEAYKEFAELVKANKRKLFNYIYSSTGFDNQIDNLLKEMVGDTNV